MLYTGQLNIALITLLSTIGTVDWHEKLQSDGHREYIHLVKLKYKQLTSGRQTAVSMKLELLETKWMRT